MSNTLITVIKNTVQYNMTTKESMGEDEFRELIKTSLNAKGRVTPVSLDAAAKLNGGNHLEMLPWGIHQPDDVSFKNNYKIDMNGAPPTVHVEIDGAKTYSGQLGEYVVGHKISARERDSQSMVLNDEIGVSDEIPFNKSRSSAMGLKVSMIETLESLKKIESYDTLLSAQAYIGDAADLSSRSLGIDYDRFRGVVDGLNMKGAISQMDKVIEKLNTVELMSDPQAQVSHAKNIETSFSLVQQAVAQQLQRTENIQDDVESIEKLMGDLNLSIDEDSIAPSPHVEGAYSYSAFVSADLKGSLDGVAIDGEMRARVWIDDHDVIAKYESYNDINVTSDVGIEKKADVIEKVDGLIEKTLHERDGGTSEKLKRVLPKADELKDLMAAQKQSKSMGM